MTEFGISIGAKISEYLVEPILIRPLRPIFCFGSIVADFRDQKDRLTATQVRVQSDVERDSDNARVIYDHVKEWLQNVNAAMQEVQRLENELVQNKSCFRYSWCPNWTYHYCFSRQVSKMAATLQTLYLQGGFFISVSHAPALHQDIIGSSSSPSFIHSQSSRSAFDQIMEALKRDDVNLIKLYGLAGAGKTTMAQLVGEEAKKLFYRVIMVPITQYPLVRSQQGFVADFLGLQFDQLEGEQGRAAKLQLRLKNGEKILIIFDDVHKEFNSGAIIGNLSLDSGCKILLTTHAEIHVHTQKDIQLGVLSEDEAWTLLKSTAGVGDEVRTHDVAKDALADCNSLPKAIVAMGTVLNGKDVQDWEDTLQKHNTAKFKFIDSLEEGVKKLSLRQDRVNIKINTAKEKDEKIYADVEKWLKDVERVVNDVEQFKNELNQNRWCLDELGAATRGEALATRVKDLHEQGNIDPVSHPTPLEPDMRLLSSEDFLFSEAAKSAFHQILEAWKTDGVNMIGLYGMGGIGKTTLATQVHNEVIRKNESAVMVTVSQKPDVGNMQDKIADFLDLELKKKTLEGRAIELKNRLKDKKILIILDDVWKLFDLGSIGITLADCKGCKILMTTRRKDVCSSMECQPEIQLDLFSEDESQKLFKKKAGLSNEFELDDVGKQIVAECKRLPVALETVGAALKRKGKDEWEEALGKLRSARLVDIIGVHNDEKNVYRCLKLSYDYLHDQPEAQFILLLCCLFPEDYEIEVEDLTRYAFGMELFEEVKSIKDARRNVRMAIRFLKGSCLLLDAGGEQYVKLHDVVRDVLLWVGGTELQERNVLTVRDGVHLKVLMRKKSFQNCKALSFTSDVIPKFSKYSELEFPNLEIVLIWGTDFVEFGEGFFEHVKHLKVLDVRSSSRERYKFAMPPSPHCLEHLRSLMLRNCECSNSNILRDLVRLRVLSLHECEIDGGVELVSGLKKLRLLDLSRFWAFRVMLISDVTERLVKLEELRCTFKEAGTSNRSSELIAMSAECLSTDLSLPYLRRNGCACIGVMTCIHEGCRDKEGTSSKLYELKLPSNLVALSLKVEDVRCLPRDFCFPKLESYDIHIGSGYTHNPLSSTREVSRLMLGRIGEDVMMKTCEELLPTVQWLHLYKCDDLYSLPSFTLQMLEILVVEECKKMEWVLKVGNVSNDFTCCCFTNLRELTVVYCEKVKAIFPLVKSTCRAHPQSHLPNLQKIDLFSNKLLKHIWEGPTTLLSLCNLTQVMIYNCPQLICIFPSLSLAASLQQLEILKIELCHNLEDVFSRRGGSDDDDFTCCCFTNLRELKVYGCDKVKAIFPLEKSTSRAPHLHRCRLPKLQEIVVENNSLLEHIFGHQTQAEDGVECPSLQVLDITDCPQISTTHLVATQLQAPSSMSYVQIVEARPQSSIICFSFLNRVELKHCNKLKQVFSTTTVTSLHLLEVLIVQGCNELEQVVGEVGDGKEEPTIGVSFENLRTLRVSHCGKLRTIFPVSMALPQLQELELKSNAELEHVYGRSDWDCTWQCPFLKVLRLGDCPKLCLQFAACILSPSTTKAVKKNKLADLVTSTSTHLVATQLQAPSSMSYIQIVEASTVICFSFLNRVELKDCNKLKQVFSTATVTSLHLLEVLIVQGCNELEQVAGKVGDGKEEPTIGVSFENLKTLRVSHCGKLRTIFPISIALPQLQELELKSNAELEHVFGRSDWDCTWQCTVLKDLCLEDCTKLCLEFAACMLNPSTTEAVEKNKLAPIQGGNDDLVTSTSKKLSPWNSEDIKGIQSGPTQNICFARLYQIKVIGCHKLKHLFTTNLATNFPDLKRIIVRRCNELEEVIMFEDGDKERENDATSEMIGKVGFEKLEVLHVSDCKKLKTVFSTFIPLPKLHTLLLQSNAVLESLFGRSDYDCTLYWTCLSVLWVTGCPELCTKTIAIIRSQLQVQSTTKEEWRTIHLSNIQGVDELIQLPRQEGGDVHQTVVLRDSYFLKAEELGDLKRIWRGPTQDISFSFVVAVKVKGCSKLKQLFTTTMATSLHNLRMLSVESCHDLQQIIEEEEENNTQSVQQLLEFSNLEILRLIDLPKLISFCPTSCNLAFPHLRKKSLKVIGCPKPLTDFFSQQTYQEESEEVEYFSEGEQEDEDRKFEDDIYRNYCTDEFVLARFGLELKN